MNLKLVALCLVVMVCLVTDAYALRAWLAFDKMVVIFRSATGKIFVSCNYPCADMLTLLSFGFSRVHTYRYAEFQDGIA